MTTKKLTENQTYILHIIESFKNEKGHFPTAKELAHSLGFNSISSADRYINMFREKGYIEESPKVKSIILTERKKQILNAIELYIIEHGYSPTVRELCGLVKLKSTSSIQQHLDDLERGGYIKKEKDSPRTIRILRTA